MQHALVRGHTEGGHERVHQGPDWTWGLATCRWSCEGNPARCAAKGWPEGSEGFLEWWNAQIVKKSLVVVLNRPYRKPTQVGWGRNP